MSEPLNRDAQALVDAARATLTPSESERERYEKLVMGAVAASVVTAVTSTATAVSSTTASASVQAKSFAIGGLTATKTVGLAVAFLAVGFGGYAVGKHDASVERADVRTQNREVAPHYAAVIASPARASLGSPLPADQVPATSPALQMPSAARVERMPAPDRTPMRDVAPNALPTAERAQPEVAAPSTSSLARESELLHRARGALGSSAPQAALQFLSEHREQFPSGTLTREAALLRIRTLCALGRLNDARTELTRAAEQGNGLAQSTFEQACETR